MILYCIHVHLPSYTLSFSCLWFRLVFNFDAVNWFNDKFVTADMPPPADLETWLEVGSA